MAVQEHHKQAEFAYNRPAYREARWERSVKVISYASRCGRSSRARPGPAE